MDCEGGVCAIAIDNITAPVMEDMEQMRSNILDIVGRKNPLLLAAADQIFGAGGKRLRPVLVFLVARATAQLMAMDDITERQRRLAEITEMIHTASLVHDDVLDDCDTRRGAETIHTLYGTRVAILAGDFLFAQSSWYLANLDNLEVIKLISQVIADFADGEISQAGALFNCDVTLEGYLEKSHNKTASLIAASCKSAAVFSRGRGGRQDGHVRVRQAPRLAFQVVDDILDFTQSEEQLGKPQGQDLASGNLTAPCIFALGRNPRLRELIETQFADPKDPRGGDRDRQRDTASRTPGGWRGRRRTWREQSQGVPGGQGQDLAGGHGRPRARALVLRRRKFQRRAGWWWRDETPRAEASRNRFVFKIPLFCARAKTKCARAFALVESRDTSRRSHQRINSYKCTLAACPCPRRDAKTLSATRSWTVDPPAS